MHKLAVTAVMLTAGCGRLGVVPAADAGSDTSELPHYALTVMSAQPMAYWRLDDTGSTATDHSGHGVTGTYSVGTTQGVPGAIVGDPDAATAFDGSTGLIAVGAGFDFTGTTAFSIEAWIKPDFPLDATFRHVFTKEHRPTSGPDLKQGYALLVHAGEGITFERFVDGVQQFIDFDVAPSTSFTHVVATYSEALTQLYINGEIANRMVDNRAMPSIVETALIGAAGTSEATNFLGVIDEVAVYPTVLTPDQVQSHFAAGSGH